MINRKKAKAYELTESSRQLANFFKGVTIDEKKRILWSEQNLDILGLKPLKPLRFLDIKLYPLSFPLLLLMLILSFFLSIWHLCVLLVIETWRSALKKK